MKLILVVQSSLELSYFYIITRVRSAIAQRSLWKSGDLTKVSKIPYLIFLTWEFLNGKEILSGSDVLVLNDTASNPIASISSGGNTCNVKVYKFDCY